MKQKTRFIYLDGLAGGIRWSGRIEGRHKNSDVSLPTFFQKKVGPTKGDNAHERRPRKMNRNNP